MLKPRWKELKLGELKAHVHYPNKYNEKTSVLNLTPGPELSSQHHNRMITVDATQVYLYVFHLWSQIPNHIAAKELLNLCSLQFSFYILIST